jgi:hypothetical protein
VVIALGLNYGEVDEASNPYNPEIYEMAMSALFGSEKEAIKKLGDVWGAKWRRKDAASRANLRLRDVLKMVWIHGNRIEKWRTASWLAYRDAEDDNSFISLGIMWLVTNTTSQDVLMLLLNSGMFRVDMSKWHSIHSQLHDWVRSTGHIGDRPLSEADKQNVMYLQVLWGRSGLDANVRKEYEKRTEPPEPKRMFDERSNHAGEYTRHAFNTHARETMNELLKPQVEKMGGTWNFSKWNERLSRQAANGAVPGVNTKDLFISDVVAGIPEGTNGRMKKKAVLEMFDMIDDIRTRVSEQDELIDGWENGLAGDDIVKAALGKPHLRVSFSSKPEEMGMKERALYAAYLMESLIEDFVISPMENMNHPSIDISEKGIGTSNRVMKILSTNRSHRTGCYDYPDFNVIHEGEHLAMVFEQMHTLGKEIGAHDDWLKATAWLAKAIKHIIIDWHKKEGDDGEIYDMTVVHDTLMSGWRGTTFLNTVLNYVYVKAVESSYTKTTGRKMFKDVKCHGDDVYAVFLDEAAQMWFFMHTADHGLKANKIKTLVRVNGDRESQVAEFLRVTYKGDYSSTGSLPRALVSLVTGNWIGDVLHDPSQKISAVHDQVNIAGRRGMRSYWEEVLKQVLCEKHVAYSIKMPRAMGIIFAPPASGKSTWIGGNRFTDDNGDMFALRIEEVDVETKSGVETVKIGIIDGDEWTSWHKHRRYGMASGVAGWFRALAQTEDVCDHIIIMSTAMVLAPGMDKLPIAAAHIESETLRQHTHKRRIEHGEEIDERGIVEQVDGLKTTHNDICNTLTIPQYTTFEECVSKLAPQLHERKNVKLPVPEWYRLVSKQCGGFSTEGRMMLAAGESLPALPVISPAQITLKPDAPTLMSTREVQLLSREMHEKGLVLNRTDELIREQAKANYFSVLDADCRMKACNMTSTRIMEWYSDAWAYPPDLTAKPSVTDDEMRSMMRERVKHAIDDCIYNGGTARECQATRSISQLNQWAGYRGYISGTDDEIADRLSPGSTQILTCAKNAWEFATASVDGGVMSKVPSDYQQILRDKANEIVANTYENRTTSFLTAALSELLCEAVIVLYLQYPRLMRY